MPIYISETCFITEVESLLLAMCGVSYLLHCYYNKEISVLVAVFSPADLNPPSQSKQSAHNGMCGGTYQLEQHAQAPREHHDMFLKMDG